MSFRLWFERDFPKEYHHLLSKDAVVSGTGITTPDDPTASLKDAQGAIASAKVRYNESLFRQFPSLRVVSRTGIGVDNVNLPDATKCGVVVCNTPDAPTVATAEHAVALLLAVAKDLRRTLRETLAGVRKDYFNGSTSVELQGKRLGLVGFGRIGRHVARIMQGFGMEVVAHDPFLTPMQAEPLGVRLIANLDELLASSDVVSLHVPLSDETRHLINAERLSRMKQGAILVNAARGGLVDEGALHKALVSGHLKGAALDVFEVEPPPADHPLLQLEQVYGTPHVAGVNTSSRERVWKGAIENALQVLRNERPVHVVNPEVWDQRRK